MTEESWRDSFEKAARNYGVSTTIKKFKKAWNICKTHTFACTNPAYAQAWDYMIREEFKCDPSIEEDRIEIAAKFLIFKQSTRLAALEMEMAAKAKEDNFKERHHMSRDTFILFSRLSAQYCTVKKHLNIDDQRISTLQAHASPSQRTVLNDLKIRRSQAFKKAFPMFVLVEEQITAARPQIERAWRPDLGLSRGEYLCDRLSTIRKQLRSQWLRDTPRGLAMLKELTNDITTLGGGGIWYKTRIPQLGGGTDLGTNPTAWGGESESSPRSVPDTGLEGERGLPPGLHSGDTVYRSAHLDHACSPAISAISLVPRVSHPVSHDVPPPPSSRRTEWTSSGTRESSLDAPIHLTSSSSGLQRGRSGSSPLNVASVEDDELKFLKF